MRRLRKLYHRTKHFLVPHRGNKYRAGIFAKESIAVIAGILLLIEGISIVSTKVALDNTGFLASVLPAALQTLANADRASNGIASLEFDATLTEAAQAKADDMAAKGYFAHTSPDGRTLRDWLSAAGYEYSYAGENLAVDFTESADVESAWMNSPTHRANLLKAEYTHVGYGVARGMYEGREVMFVAQFFAAKKGATSVRALAAAPAASPRTTEAEEVRVLGTETVAAEPEQYADADGEAVHLAERAAVVVTSPRTFATYAIIAITAVIAVLFSIAVLIHARIGLVHLEMIAGFIILVLLAAGLYVYNGNRDDTGSVGSQAAATALAI